MKTERYFKLYQDPRWQKLRLKVMEKANFECQECFTKNKTLHTHHKYYKKDAKPWEYELHELVCLCEDCHQKFHEKKQEIQRLIGEFSNLDITYILGSIWGLVLQTPYPIDGKLIQERTLQDLDKDELAHFLLGIKEQYNLSTEIKEIVKNRRKITHEYLIKTKKQETENNNENNRI